MLRERFELLDEANRSLARMCAAERGLELERRLLDAQTTRDDRAAAELRASLLMNQAQLTERIEILRDALRLELETALAAAKARLSR